MNLRFVTVYVSATLVISIALALCVTAILLGDYSRGWLLIPAGLFAGLGFVIRKMQG